jgi:hypothetical protein
MTSPGQKSYLYMPPSEELLLRICVPAVAVPGLDNAAVDDFGIHVNDLNMADTVNSAHCADAPLRATMQMY